VAGVRQQRIATNQEKFESLLGDLESRDLRLLIGNRPALSAHDGKAGRDHDSQHEDHENRGRQRESTTFNVVQHK